MKITALLTLSVIGLFSCAKMPENAAIAAASQKPLTVEQRLERIEKLLVEERTDRLEKARQSAGVKQCHDRCREQFPWIEEGPENRNDRGMECHDNCEKQFPLAPSC